MNFYSLSSISLLKRRFHPIVVPMLCLTLILTLISGTAAAAHKTSDKPPSVGTQKADVDVAQKIVIPEYVTPLQSFKKYVESDEPDWKKANDLVGEIGGWREYAREAYLAERQEREAREKVMQQQKADEQKVNKQKVEDDKTDPDDADSQWSEVKNSDGETE